MSFLQFITLWVSKNKTRRDSKGFVPAASER
jgi:hypothetical protein